jgi:hypothetical protein
MKLSEAVADLPHSLLGIADLDGTAPPHDGKEWSTLGKRDLADALKGGGSIEEAATFL